MECSEGARVFSVLGAEDKSGLRLEDVLRLLQNESVTPSDARAVVVDLSDQPAALRVGPKVIGKLLTDFSSLSKPRGEPYQRAVRKGHNIDSKTDPDVAMDGVNDFAGDDETFTSAPERYTHARAVQSM